MLRDEYLTLRRCYEPKHVKLVVVAESPPASGLYFYNPEGRATEPLFSALMKQLDWHGSDKAGGLRKLQQCGWLLIDATYEPVDELSDAGRQKVIERDFQALCDDLKRSTPDRTALLILIKENVCRILESRLVREGFKVLNRGMVIPFPSTGHQKQFHEKFAAVCRSAAVETKCSGK
jgi:hypothetical protein